MTHILLYGMRFQMSVQTGFLPLSVELQEILH